MGPPKCKTCGKTEWNHLCWGRDKPFVPAFGLIANKEGKVIAALDFKAPNPTGETLTITYPQATKPSRKEYLKLKARERRARQKAAKETAK